MVYFKQNFTIDKHWLSDSSYWLDYHSVLSEGVPVTLRQCAPKFKPLTHCPLLCPNSFSLPVSTCMISSRINCYAIRATMATISETTLTII